MKEMSEFRIDMPYLLFAWQDDSPDNAYYLDTESGDVKLVNRNLIELNDLTDEIECNRDRYLYLPKPDPQQLKNDLQDFMLTVADDKLKNVLLLAFESPHVLSSFKKILENTPAELSRLEEFRKARTLTRMNQWLEANRVSVSADTELE